MRAAETIEVGGAAAGFVTALERLLEARPGAKLVWLQDGAGPGARGELAHLAGLTKRFGLPVIEERRGVGAAVGLLRVEPHDHVVRLADGWISVPSALARLMRPLATALGVGAPSDG
jgi:hypothetical protein